MSMLHHKCNRGKTISYAFRHFESSIMTERLVLSGIHKCSNKISGAMIGHVITEPALYLNLRYNRTCVITEPVF